MGAQTYFDPKYYVRFHLGRDEDLRDSKLYNSFVLSNYSLLFHYQSRPKSYKPFHSAVFVVKTELSYYSSKYTPVIYRHLMAVPQTPRLKPSLCSQLQLLYHVLTSDCSSETEDKLNFELLRLDPALGQPDQPSSPKSNFAEAERTSGVLTIVDQSDSPRQGMSVLQWLHVWELDWEKAHR